MQILNVGKKSLDHGFNNRMGARLNHSLHGKLSTRTKKIIANLMMTQNKAILLYYPGIKWQSGTNDCGLFAVAFTTSLCIDEDTTEVMYDQQSMRQYRRDCLVAGELVSIPECAPRR